MKRVMMLLGFLFLTIFSFSQIEVHSIRDGAWSDPNTWDKWVPRDYVDDEIVFVHHHVELDKDLSRASNKLIIDSTGALVGKYKINVYGDTGRITNYGYLEVDQLTGTGILENYDTIIVNVEVDNFYGEHKFYNYDSAYFWVKGNFKDDGELEINYGTIKVEGDFNINDELKNYGILQVSGEILFNSSSSVTNYGQIKCDSNIQTNAVADNEGLIITYGQFYQNNDMTNNGAIYVFGDNNYYLQWGKNLNSSTCGYVNVGCNVFENNGSVTGKININGQVSGSGTFGPEVTFNPYNDCENNPVVYISRRSGYWDDIGTCTSEGGTWSSRSMYPEPIYEFPHYGGTVIISKGHTVVMRNDGPTNLACDSLVIEPSAALTIEDSVKLTVRKDVIIKSPADSQATGSLIDYGKLIIERNAIVERYLTGYRWHFIGSPVDTIELSKFFMRNFYYYDETTDDWWEGDTIYGTSGWKHPTAALTDSPMVGYIYYYMDDTLVFRGSSFNTDTLVKFLSFTANYPDRPEFDGWNLICNPYPSAIDWDLVNTDGVADACIYYYDDDGSPPYYNNYRYYIKGGDGESPYPSTAVNQGSRFIPVAQAFFVKTTNNGAKLVFDNSIRVHSFPAFYKQKKHSNLLRLGLSKEDAIDEMVIRFLSGATEHFDGKFDAYKMFASGLPQLYSITKAAEHLAINTLPLLKDTIVALAYIAPQKGIYKLKAMEINFGDTVEVFLLDKREKIRHSLSKYPVYEFYSDRGKVEDRFVIEFKINAPAAKQTADSNFLQIFGARKKIKLIQFGDLKAISVTVYSVDGREIFMGLDTVVEMEIDVPMSGVYLVKAIVDGKTLVKKVLVY